jgi:hypothetical protein
MPQTYCKVLGVALLAVGVLGFAVPNLLGMHLTAVHNVVHLASGALALYFGSKGFSAARGFCQAFGIVYLGLAVLGFVAPGLLSTILGHPMQMSARELMPDNIVHVVLGATSLAFGMVREHDLARRM